MGVVKLAAKAVVQENAEAKAKARRVFFIAKNPFNGKNAFIRYAPFTHDQQTHTRNATPPQKSFVNLVVVICSCGLSLEI